MAKKLRSVNGKFTDYVKSDEEDDDEERVEEE